MAAAGLLIASQRRFVTADNSNSNEAPPSKFPRSMVAPQSTI